MDQSILNKTLHRWIAGVLFNKLLITALHRWIAGVLSNKLLITAYKRQVLITYTALIFAMQQGQKVILS